MSNEQNIQPRLLEPGYNIIQGRGGQAFVLDVNGNMFLTSPNKSNEQQTDLSINKSVSSIAIMVNTGSIINTSIKYSSENFNTLNQEQNIEDNKTIIQSLPPTSSSDLNVAVDILPTSSITSSIQTQTQIIEKTKSSKEIELEFLPEIEDSLNRSGLYDENIEGEKIQLISYINIPGISLGSSNDTKATLEGNYSTFTDNNPFNVISTSDKWKGKIGSKKAANSGLIFIVFDNIENGIRAGLINLSIKFTSYKLNTIEKIINVYAPGGSLGQSKSATLDYIKNATEFLQQNWNKNIKSNTVLIFNGKKETDSNNIKMFKTLAKAILKIEGVKNYTNKNISIIDNFDVKNLN